MEIKEIKLKNLTIKNNVFFAPLAGYSTAEMRSICYELGIGLCFTEMVSAKGLKYKSQNTEDLLYTYSNENPIAVQIFGSNPEIMGEIACSEYLEKFKIIDINMGCPVPKIYNNNEGSYLLNDLVLASKIIESVAKSKKDVSVKFRIGIDDDKLIARDFAKMCEDSGASLITIHGRTKKAIYSGEVNYKQIETAKNSVKIPVIANGGVFSEQDANILMERTGADGVMLARSVLENPLIICDILKTKRQNLKTLIKKQIDLTSNRYGKERSAVLLRKQMAYYLKGEFNSKKLKEEIFACQNADELKQIIDKTTL